MAQCPNRGPALDCTADYKVRPDGKCAFCGGVVGRPTDGMVTDRENWPKPGICQPAAGMHPAMVYALDGPHRRGWCQRCLAELYRRSG